MSVREHRSHRCSSENMNAETRKSPGCPFLSLSSHSLEARSLPEAGALAFSGKLEAREPLCSSCVFLPWGWGRGMPCIFLFCGCVRTLVLTLNDWAISPDPFLLVYFLFLCICFLFKDRVLCCSPELPIQYSNLAQPQICSCPPASDSWVLGLQTHDNLPKTFPHFQILTTQQLWCQNNCVQQKPKVG